MLSTTLSVTGVLFFARIAHAETTLERIKRTGKVIVGVANERPYGYVETSGRLAGSSPDVIFAALQPHGVKEMQAEIVDFDALIPGLNADRYDIVGADMFIQPSRCQAMAFTNPVTRSGYGFVAVKGNPKEVHSLAELAKRTDVVVGTQNGSSQVEELAKAAVPNDRIVLFTNSTEALAGMKAGRCDIIYFPGLELNQLLMTANDPMVERVKNFQQVLDADGKPEYSYGGLGVRKADTDLLAVLNTEIAKMLASGKLLEIDTKYGYGKDEIPTADVTAEKLCKA
jgi:polar amino acid transport system substrate-binding protein